MIIRIKEEAMIRTMTIRQLFDGEDNVKRNVRKFTLSNVFKNMHYLLLLEKHFCHLLFNRRIKLSSGNCGR